MTAILEDTSTEDSVDSAVVTDSATTVSEEEDRDVTKQHTEEQTPLEPDEPRTEGERLDPAPSGPVTLVSGTQVEIVPLKLRETMKLLKIVTRGAGSVLEQLMGDLNLDDPAAFAQTFGALIFLAIPEAEDEAVQFIQAMVLPTGFEEMDQKAKIDSLTKLSDELFNPELDDVITIIERVVRRESEDIRNLAKRISTALSLARKVGDLPDNS